MRTLRLTALLLDLPYRAIPYLAIRRFAIRCFATLCLALPTLVPAQYVGRVGQANLDQKPVLRATAVYQYTGSMAKPKASRLVPVVVWDGTRFQPGGVYLAQPEPLAVAPGTQYVLTPKGVPAGLFNVLSAEQQNGAWVALGRYAVPAPPPPPAKLRASRDIPLLHGGVHMDEDQDASGGPILHRHAGSAGDAKSNSGDGATAAAAPNAPRSPAPKSAPAADSGSNTADAASNAPVLHRRDTSSNSSSNSPSNSSPNASSNQSPTPANGSTASSQPAPPADPDRPVLHRPSSASGSASATPTALDPDRPVLHRHAGGEGGDVVIAPDPDRPHLRYGRVPQSSLVLPVLLETQADPAHGTPALIDQVVAVSDIDSDPPHNFGYEWPSEVVRTSAEQALHDVAVRALAAVVTASFGPGAAADDDLRRAAAAQQVPGFGPAAQAAPAVARTKSPSIRRSGTRSPVPAPARPTSSTNPPTDPLADPEFHAFTLSYGGGTAWVYSAHTRADGPARRYVTVIAAPDFYGKPQVLFQQTTRGGTLDETPALHLVDAVDADGDHRAELLFAEQTSLADDPASARQFALFRVLDGKATEVYATPPDVTQ